MAAVDLYHALWSPPSRSVRMIGKAVGVKFNLITCDPIMGDHLKPDFLKMNPLHTIPTINDNGLILWESRAIGQYLVKKYAPNSSLIPTDLKRRAIYDQMLFFDYSLLYNFSSLMRPVFMGAKQFDPKLLKNCRTSMKLLDQFLSASEYLAGDQITMVDYSAAATVVTGKSGTIDLSIYPHVDRWLSKISAEIADFEEINGPGLEMMTAFVSALPPPDGAKSKL